MYICISCEVAHVFKVKLDRLGWSLLHFIRFWSRFNRVINIRTFMISVYSRNIIKR